MGLQSFADFSGIMPGPFPRPSPAFKSMARGDKSTPSGCTHAALASRGAISLPVLAEHQPRGAIRKSKSGRRRALVLAAVQLLIIVHIALWLSGAWGGRTL